MKNKRETDAANRAAHLAQRQADKARRKSTPELSREKAKREERQRILIYCEGANTEPSYFNEFRLATADVRCFGEGRNTKSLVERALFLKDESEKKGNPYDQVWCVFDRDPQSANKGGHSAKDFNEAIQLAEQHDLHVAYSNQAFEYWLILHFNDHQGGSLPRSDYNRLLNEYLKPHNCSYDGREKKVTKAFFDILEAIDPAYNKSRRALASERAEKIMDRLPDANFATAESSTTVFKLVRILAADAGLSTP